MATATKMRRPETQSIPVSFTLNGRLQEIDVEPHELLLDVVRERFGLTGVKRSCDVKSAVHVLCLSTVGR